MCLRWFDHLHCCGWGAMTCPPAPRYASFYFENLSDKHSSAVGSYPHQKLFALSADVRRDLNRKQSVFPMRVSANRSSRKSSEFETCDGNRSLCYSSQTTGLINLALVLLYCQRTPWFVDAPCGVMRLLIRLSSRHCAQRSYHTISTSHIEPAVSRYKLLLDMWRLEPFSTPRCALVETYRGTFEEWVFVPYSPFTAELASTQ